MDSLISRHLRWLLLPLLAMPAPVIAQNDRPSHGPLTYDEGSPLQRIAITPIFEAAEIGAVGSVTADLALGYANLFEQDSAANHLVHVDMEHLMSAIAVRWVVAEGWEVGTRGVWTTTGPGILDDFILDWHDFFGFGQANRDRWPSHQYDQRITNGGATTYLDVPAQTLGLEELRFHVKTVAIRTPDGRGLLSVKAEGRLPGQPNPVADRLFDVSATAYGRLTRGAWHWHGMLGIASARVPDHLDPVVRAMTQHIGIAAERSFGPVSAVAQYQVQSPLLTGFGHKELEWPSWNLILGFSGRLGDTWTWDASFQEDLPADTPAVDFTFALRLSRTW